MSWVADGQDGNRLYLEKMKLIFQVYSFCLGKLAKTLIMVYFFLENPLDIFLLVFYKISCMSKVLSYNLRQI